MFNGNRFRLSPDHTFSAGVTASADVPGGRLDFTPAVTYQSKVFFDNDNDRPDLQTIAPGKIVADTVQDEFQDGFALVSARLGYNFSGSSFRIEGFVENLFRQGIHQGRRATPATASAWQPSSPVSRARMASS